MSQEQSQHNFWEREFKSVESTNVKPIRTATKPKTYSEVARQVDEALKSVDPHLYSQLIKGQLMSKNKKLTDDDYITVVYTIIKCVFQCVRDSINDSDAPLEDRQAELIKVSSAESVFLSGLEVLSSLKIKLDINLVYAIIHGYIGQCVNTAVTNYEHTRSIKH